MNNKFVFIFYITLLVGCNNEREPQTGADIKIISINPGQKSKGLFSDLFESVNYIPLDDSVLVGDVSRLKVTENYFFILNENTQSIMRFNKNGRFINEIYNPGSGPGEYATIEDFEIDTTKKQIEVLDRGQLKNIIYDYEGNLISEWKHGYLALSFKKGNDNDYFFYMGNERTPINNNKKLYSTRQNFAYGFRAV